MPLVSTRANSISVIDDDESIRDSTRTLLRSAGYRVGTFASAEHFLESGALRETGCIILDVRMPGISGLDLQSSLKASHSSVPIIFVSAHDELANRHRAIAAGAIDFLCKPFDASALMAAIENAAAAREKSLQGEFVTISTQSQPMDHEWNQFMQTLGAANVAVWSADITSGNTFYSPELEHLCGLPLDGTFRGALQCIHPEDRASVEQAAGNLLSDGSVTRLEFRIVRPDGEVRWAEALGTLQRDDLNRPQRAAGLISDISERKQREHALRNSNEELIQFSYAASHDLQEPLRAVISYGQLLSRTLDGQASEEANKYLGFILDGAGRLEALLRDLRIYTELSQEPEDHAGFVDCGEALEEVRANLQTAIENSGAVITNDPLPVVAGRKIDFIELFQNLLSNAIKYRSADPPVIHVSAKSNGGEYVFSIRDNGVGIDPKYAKDIFTAFRRLRRDLPGTGMGLAICKRIVERSGGKIWLQSAPGKGSTFFLTMRSARTGEKPERRFAESAAQ